MISAPYTQYIHPFSEKWTFVRRALCDAEYDTILAMVLDGFDVNMKEPGDKPLLFVALEQLNRDRKLEMVQFLLTVGADPNMHDHRGRAGPAIRYTRGDKWRTFDSELLDLLLAHGADPNVIDGNFRMSILHTACIYGDLRAVKSLVEHRANIEYMDERGWTAKDIAELECHDDIYQYLEKIEAVRRKYQKAAAIICSVKSRYFTVFGRCSHDHSTLQNIDGSILPRDILIYIARMVWAQRHAELVNVSASIVDLSSAGNTQ